MSTILIHIKRWVDTSSTMTWTMMIWVCCYYWIFQSCEFNSFTHSKFWSAQTIWLKNNYSLENSTSVVLQLYIVAKVTAVVLTNVLELIKDQTVCLGYDLILVKQQKWTSHQVCFNYHLNYHCSRSRNKHHFSTKPSSTQLPHTASQRHCGCGGTCCLPVWGSIRFSKCHIHLLWESWQLHPHLPLRTCGRYSPGKVVPSSFSVDSKILILVSDVLLHHSNL